MKYISNNTDYDSGLCYRSKQTEFATHTSKQIESRKENTYNYKLMERIVSIICFMIETVERIKENIGDYL